MEYFSPLPINLSGCLLVAHPELTDPNFKRRVVLISTHSREDGALGVIINWSMEQTLGEFNAAFELEVLGGVPLGRGGPVAGDQLIFTAWHWAETDHVFRLAFGIGPDQARDLLDEAGYEVRAFLGCAGWGPGQLEEELAHNSWVIAKVDGKIVGGVPGESFWRDLVGCSSPEMKLWVDFPEDPSVN